MARYFLTRGDRDIFVDTAVAANGNFPPAVDQTATTGTCADMRVLLDVERCKNVVVTVRMSHQSAASATLAHPLDAYWADTPSHDPASDVPPSSYQAASYWTKESIATAMTSYTAADPNSRWHTRYQVVFTNEPVAQITETGRKVLPIKGAFLVVSAKNAHTAQTAHISVSIDKNYE